MTNGYKKLKEVRGQSNQVHRAATPLTLDVRWTPVRPGDVDEDEFSAASGGGAGKFTVDGKRVMAVKHYPGSGQRVELSILHSLMAFNPDSFELTLENKLDRTTAKFTDSDGKLRLVHLASGYLKIDFDVDDLFATLATTVNLNLVHASVKLTGTSREGTAVEGTGETAKLLHVLLQRAIVLLPGVMASSLWVKGVKCIPSLMSNTANNLARLSCHASGNPVNELTKITFIEPGHPYDTDKWEGILNEGFPKLVNSEGKTLRYTFFQGWPYDWRLKAEDVVGQLLGPLMSDEDVQRTHDNWSTMFCGQPTFRNKSPSLRTIIRNRKRKAPFLHDKVALAGHSTGGVIMNGAIRSAGVEHLVDRAFFLATPFYGALKAYNAFLKGTMDLGFAERFVIDKDTFLTDGANLPVLYYLSPTSSFPYAVGKIEYPPTLANPDPSQHFNLAADAPGVAKTFMDEVIRLAHLHKIDRLIRNNTHWNPTLANAAHQYHSVTCKAAIRIGEKNCLAFYSDFGPKSTIGTITYNGDPNYEGKAVDRIKYAMTGGDGTVPAESLTGPFTGNNKRLWKSEQETLDHVTILTDKKLWKEIAKRLATEQKE